MKKAEINRMQKDDVIAALNESGVDFDETAKLPELKKALIAAIAEDYEDSPEPEDELSLEEQVEKAEETTVIKFGIYKETGEYRIETDLKMSDSLIVKVYQKDGDKKNRAGFNEVVTTRSIKKLLGYLISKKEDGTEVIGAIIGGEKVVKVEIQK